MIVPLSLSLAFARARTRAHALPPRPPLPAAYESGEVDHFLLRGCVSRDSFRLEKLFPYKSVLWVFCGQGGSWFRPQHAGSKTRGKREVLFRSRDFSIAEIQSEIVLGYLHYLDSCTV